MSNQNRNIFLVDVDDLGLDFKCLPEIAGIDDLFSNLKHAGAAVGISFEETFEVNNDTMTARFSFTSSQDEETVEALLDSLAPWC